MYVALHVFDIVSDSATSTSGDAPAGSKSGDAPSGDADTSSTGLDAGEVDARFYSVLGHLNLIVEDYNKGVYNKDIP